MEQVIRIAEFILNSFIHIWPYLLVTIPLAVIINLTGASKYITRAFGKNPLLSVLLATIVGAFSPFCSCGVIPVISSLLLGGVPLAPVMSFWIASPSMDPEIFFLSSSVLGMKLAIWRLASTFIISLLAGYITHFATVRGFIAEQTGAQLLAIKTGGSGNSCCTVSASMAGEKCECAEQTVLQPVNNNDQDAFLPSSQWKRVISEIWKATLLVVKFMGLAFFITALIKFYLPEDLISGIVTANPTFQVVLATLIGIPMYTTNITALPIAGGLIDLGLNQGAALSFLIAGATTTLPAMAAVWGITRRRVFLLYLSFALFGALFAGLCFNLFN